MNVIKTMVDTKYTLELSVCHASRPLIRILNRHRRPKGLGFKGFPTWLVLLPVSHIAVITARHCPVTGLRHSAYVNINICPTPRRNFTLSITILVPKLHFCFCGEGQINIEQGPATTDHCTVDERRFPKD